MDILMNHTICNKLKNILNAKKLYLFFITINLKNI